MTKIPEILKYLASLSCLLLSLAFSLPGACEEGRTADETAKRERSFFSSKKAAPCTINIHGNEFLSDSSLQAAAKEELTSFRDKGYKLSAIDDAAFQMENTYRLNGFVDALVAYKLEDPSGPGCQVFFQVTEGRRHIIHTITLQGVSAFDSSRLLSLEKSRMYTIGQQKIPLPYVEGEVTSLLKNIRNYYLAAGYLDVEVESQRNQVPDTPGSYTLVITVLEGKRYSIDAVQFTGDVQAEFKQELDLLKDELIGQKFQQRHILLLRIKLEELYQNRGYADTTVFIREQKDMEKGSVLLSAEILSGEKIEISEIKLTGLKRTKESFVYKQLQFRPGETYSLENVRESYSALYETGLFRTVSIKLEKDAGLKHRPILVELEEKLNRELYIEPGWGSYELLRLGAGYRDSNLFGGNHRYRIDTGISTKGRSVETAFTEPRLLGTDIDLDIPVYYRYREEPTFTNENSGFSVYLSKKFSDRIQLTAGYKNDMNNTTDIDLTGSSSGTTNKYTAAFLTMQVVRDTRDDYFFPTKGYRGFTSADISSPLVGSNLSFFRLKAGARMFRSVGKSSVLGLRYATGIIVPFGEQEGLPLGERYYNGGENSVRSFKESQLGPIGAGNQPLGGTAYNVFNLEWRYKITNSIASSIFVDLGNVAPNNGDDVESLLAGGSRKELVDQTLEDFFRDMQIGVGAGLQYLLPVGPARLDFAFNPNAQKEKDESSYVVHFSIGMAF